MIAHIYHMSTGDVNKLDAFLEREFKSKPERAPQFLRMSFHEAGSFNKQVPEGGGTGCLLNHAATQGSREHNGLAKGDLTRQGDPEGPIVALNRAKDAFNAQNSCATKLSSADITQYAGIWAAHRQAESGVIKAAMAGVKKSFKWGRKDITSSTCQAKWTHNLPGFQNGNSRSFANRMAASALEIKNKMQGRNGFTIKEAVALVGGAHSFGKIRDEGFSGMAGPWVTGGDTNGGKFGIRFFKFGQEVLGDLAPNKQSVATGSGRSFGSMFPFWWGRSSRTRAWLDTDVCLVTHSDFASLSTGFANNERDFAKEFATAVTKMATLGAKFR
jgi:catalase (peroxidase I)